MQANQHDLRVIVRGAYDLQKLRIQINNIGIYEQSENDPAPMIDLLKRTLEFVRAGG